MAGLDQGRHPLRFAVAASTVSGLLVVLFTAAAGLVWRSWPGRHVLLVLLLGAGWVLAAVLLVQRARHQGRGSRQVFLIADAFTDKRWVAQLIGNLHEILERRGYDMVLKIPDRDYSAQSQIRLLNAIATRRHAYAGGFIMASGAQAMRADLTRFHRQTGTPVVFVDASPFADGDTYPPGTAYAGCDDQMIGAAAARWIARSLHGRRIRRPVVLIINGGLLPRREQAFREQLKAQFPDVSLISATAGFDRSRASQVMAAHLRQLDAAGRSLHAVFCTNDDMALGAADALAFAPISWAASVIVAGVDGTPDARALITAGPGPLRATVVQDSYKVAEAAVGLLEKMLRKEPVPEQTSVPVEIFARD